MESFDALPDVPIEGGGACSLICLEQGIGNLQELGRRLRDLPYGRTTDRADWASVLSHGRGTCSTKHAFLAATAAELRVRTPLSLTLGLYEMCEANTPGVGATLAEAKLPAVPEAHCYVRHRATRIDVTRGNADPAEAIVFLREETIGPDQVGDYKVAWHQRQMRAWCDEHSIDDWQRIWEIRERCIHALSEAP